MCSCKYSNSLANPLSLRVFFIAFNCTLNVGKIDANKCLSYNKMKNI